MTDSYDETKMSWMNEAYDTNVTEANDTECNSVSGTSESTPKLSQDVEQTVLTVIEDYRNGMQSDSEDEPLYESAPPDEPISKRSEVELVQGTHSWIAPDGNARTLRNIGLHTIEAKKRNTHFHVFLRRLWQDIKVFEANEKRKQREAEKGRIRLQEEAAKKKAEDLANADVDTTADQIASGKILLTIDEYEKLKKEAQTKSKTSISGQSTDASGKGKGKGKGSEYPPYYTGKGSDTWQSDTWWHSESQGKGKSYGKPPYYDHQSGHHYGRGDYSPKGSGKGNKGKGHQAYSTGKGKGHSMVGDCGKGKSKGKGCTSRLIHVYENQFVNDNDVSSTNSRT